MSYVYGSKCERRCLFSFERISDFFRASCDG